MGGKALKNTYTRRYNSYEYNELSDEVIDSIQHYWSWSEVIPAYFSKRDFGDMDVLVANSAYNNRRIEIISTLFSPNEIVKNGNVVSFDYKEFQIDLIFVDSSYYYFAFGYFAYNDLGNFIGRTAHRLGFKFGHDGLWYSLRDPDCENYLVKEILVTDDFDNALTFLGFDPAIHRDGFNCPTDIFEYAASSQYFDPAQFLLHNRSCEARKRDRTRKMYTEMLQWILKEYSELDPNADPVAADKNFHLIRALDTFPKFKSEYESEFSSFQTLKRFKKNFNGENYSAWFGIQGKDLGVLMKKHREYIEHFNLKEWVGTLDREQFRVVASAINAGVK